MNIKKVGIGTTITLCLTAFTIISGIVLVSPSSYANDSAVDNVNITVPVACTLSGTGMNTHNATINPGTVNSNIGETTMKALCNDNNGFAIYAIGYTNDTEGNNTLVSTTLSPTQTITTGTETSGGTSKWAMKLSPQTNPVPTYPITIQNSFDQFHTVPDDYTLVAKRTSGTDIGTSAEGSIIKTTYQAYISSTQAADTYTGQVKYVMVHPNDAAAPETLASYQVIVNPVSSYQYGMDMVYSYFSVSFSADGYATQTVTELDTVTLYDGVEYSITATPVSGNAFGHWNFGSNVVYNGSCGSLSNASTNNPVAATFSGDSSISVIDISYSCPR